MELQKATLQAQKWYGTKRSHSGWLISDHAIDVANYMDDALNFGGEVSSKVQRQMVLACLGHDLFEDTNVSREIVIKEWGVKAVNLIDGLTNLKGDNDFDDYIRNLAHAKEEILLVKYADILSNLKNSIEKINDMDMDWVRTFWLPLLRRYEAELLPRNFVLYPKTAAYLKKAISEDIKTLAKMAK